MGGLNVVKILSYGVFGLGFLLAFLAYRLLTLEQNRELVRPDMLHSIYIFMGFSVILCALGLIGQALPGARGSHSTVLEPAATTKNDANVEQRLAIGIRNYFGAQDWLSSDPAEVFGSAKGIVQRFGNEPDVFSSVRVDIENHKKNDANWTYANKLSSALALVQALGLSSATENKNQVFLNMIMPAIPPRPAAPK